MLYNKYFFLLFIFFIIIAIIPLILWGNYYSVGGDDSLLYYMFPEKMLHFSTLIISDTILSSLGQYGQQLYQFPFYLLIVLAKHLFPVNTQLLFYGLNMSFGFVGFYLLANTFLNDKKYFSIAFITSTMYISSLFLVFTVYKTQLYAQYIVLFLPFSLFFFIKSIEKNNFNYLIILGLMTSIFSVVLLSLPWLLASFFTGIIPFGLLLKTHKKRVVIYSSSFFIIILFLNIFWIFHFLYTPFSSKNAQTTISKTNSSDFRNTNIQTINSVSSNNHIFFPLLNVYDANYITPSNNIAYGIYNNWLINLLPIDLFFIITICIAGTQLEKVEKSTKMQFFLTLFSWIISLYGITAHVGQWGIPLFIFLNNHIPGFTMFRNMFDKFGVSVAFSSSILVCISLKIIYDSFPTKYCKVLLIILSLSIFLNALPFITGKYFNNPIWTTHNTFPQIKTFNSDYINLTNYLKNTEETSRYLWLPMNYLANYVQIQDATKPNYYYSGVSPLYIFSGKTDFSGGLSFPDDKRQEIWDTIYKKDYYQLGKILQKLNVKYIIVNKNISIDLQQSYLFGKEYYDLQNTPEIHKVLLGKKIKDFGNRYSLYSINQQFINEKIFITSEPQTVSTYFNDIQFTKQASYKYTVHIKNITGTKYLVFLDPYHNLWKLYFRDGTQLNLQQKQVFGYANQWKLDVIDIKQKYKKQIIENSNGTISMNLTLYFEPQKISKYLNSISILSYSICLLYLLYKLLRTLKQKYE